MKAKYFKKAVGILLAFAMLSSIMMIVGCSPKDKLVGTWVYVLDNGELADENTARPYFNADGTCSNVPKRENGTPISYNVQDDGTIVFRTDWSQSFETKLADSEEEALHDSKKYYISGDKLIIYRSTYKKM